MTSILPYADRRHCKPETVPRGEPRACFHCAYTSCDPRNFRRHLRRHQTAVPVAVAPNDVVAACRGAVGHHQMSPGGCSPFPSLSSVDASGGTTVVTAPAPLAPTHDDYDDGGSDSSASKWAKLRRHWQLRDRIFPVIMMMLMCFWCHRLRPPP